MNYTNPCVLDDDCSSLYYCSDTDQQCYRKSFPPDTLHEMFAYLGIFIFSGLFQSAGLGGGEIFVTYMIIILKYETKLGIFLCYAIIFGGAVGKFIQTAKQKFNGKPVINYDIAVLLIPSLLIGTLVGVYFKKIFPDFFLLLSLCVLLGFAIQKIYKKALQTQESEKLQKDKNILNSKHFPKIDHLETEEIEIDDDDDDNEIFNFNSQDEIGDITDGVTEDIETDFPVSQRHVKKDDDEEEGDSFINKDELNSEHKQTTKKYTIQEAQFPPDKILILILTMIVFEFLALVKGGPESQSILKIKYCSLGY